MHFHLKRQISYLPFFLSISYSETLSVSSMTLSLLKFVFQGIGFEGMFKLAEDNNRASFILQLVYTDGAQTQLFEGRCDGEIVHQQALKKFLAWYR